MAGLKRFELDDYRQQLIALLPQGEAWRFEPDSILWNFIDGLAQEFARVDARAEAMIAESLPDKTYEMLTEWEQVAGLPDLCTGSKEGTLERRRALVAKLTASGGQSIPYFLSVINGLGYTGATIDEPEPMTCNDDCAGYLWDDDSIFCWIVNIPADLSVEYMTCNDDCQSFLTIYVIGTLECVLNRIKPSHTHVSVHYN